MPLDLLTIDNCPFHHSRSTIDDLLFSDLLFSRLEPITPEKPFRTILYEAIPSRSLINAVCITLVCYRPNHTKHIIRGDEKPEMIMYKTLFA